MQELRPLAKTTKRLDADEDMLARDFAELNTALTQPYLRVKCVHYIVSKLPNSCYGVLEGRSSSSDECQNETSAMFEDVSAAITPTGRESEWGGQQQEKSICPIETRCRQMFPRSLPQNVSPVSLAMENFCGN